MCIEYLNNKVYMIQQSIMLLGLLPKCVENFYPYKHLFIAALLITRGPINEIRFALALRSHGFIQKVIRMDVQKDIQKDVRKVLGYLV